MVAIKQSKTTSRKRPEAQGGPQLIEATVQYASQSAARPADPSTFLPVDALKAPTATELLLSELQAARLINIGMTDDPARFIALLEARIREITGTAKNVILILDEDSGTYTCLNDQVHAEFTHAPRELTWISDTYLQDLLGTESTIHSFLVNDGAVFGILAVADKLDGMPFGPRDEILLEQLTQYLSVQVNHYLALRRSSVLPTIQRILLEVSNRLLCAVDTTAILRGTMEALMIEMPFTAAQYVLLDADTGEGHVLCQLAKGQFNQGDPLKEVTQFASLLSLFQSQVWQHPVLYLKGESLGDKSFAEMFGMPGTVSVLVCPLVTDEHTDSPKVTGALIFFQQGTPVALSKEALEALEQVPPLVSSACERAGVLEKALEIATTDELTGAMNRRGLYDRLEAEIDRARRSLTPVCLTILDIDHFKIVNDTYGHLVGDQILKQFAALITLNSRKSDILCRYGGEEFVLVLPETTPQAALDLVDRLRRRVSKMAFNTSAGPIRITVSGGVDLFDTAHGLSRETTDIVSEAFGRADSALYQAKQSGRNRVISGLE